MEQQRAEPISIHILPHKYKDPLENNPENNEELEDKASEIMELNAPFS